MVEQALTRLPGRVQVILECIDAEDRVSVRFGPLPRVLFMLDVIRVRDFVRGCVNLRQRIRVRFVSVEEDDP